MESSRMKTLVFQSLKRKSQLGSRIGHAGEAMYHAATGVLDGEKLSDRKAHKLKKAFARARSSPKYDENTHSYLEHKRGV